LNVTDAAPVKKDLASAQPKVVSTVADDAIPASLPEGADTKPPDTTAGKTEPSKLLRGLLDVWGVSTEHHDKIIGCKTADELLDLDVPMQVVERILHLQSPPKLDEIVAQPNLELARPKDLADYLDGTLTGFLLRLDPEQAKVAKKQLKGPTLVKGGPGTGKSLVALYRIRNLFEPEAQATLFANAEPRVLFITYTKALSRASAQLLKRLLGERSKRVDVMTLDALAARLLKGTPIEKKRTSDGKAEQALVAAIKTTVFPGGALEKLAAQKAIGTLLRGYLAEEMSWVIDGRSLASADEYLAAERSGRGTRLDARARRAIWSVYEGWRAQLEKGSGPTYTQAQRLALKKAEALDPADRYDVVVIDEAQDLKPVGIRLAVAMAKSREGLYLTADEGQSIYGRGYSWKEVSELLDFRGRSTTLRRSYRSTVELQAACVQLANKCGLGESAERAKAVRAGKPPVLLSVKSAIGPALAKYIATWATELRVPTWSAAVLVRASRVGEAVVEGLVKSGVKAAWVESSDLDLDAHHVKVMSMHAAKGLEFPIVCVAGVDADEIPSPVREAQDNLDKAEYEKQERALLHVAMSRAMERLVVAYSAANPSPFIADLDRSLWEEVVSK
jgi:superfamily I DNA/RNA helicase